MLHVTKLAKNIFIRNRIYQMNKKIFGVSKIFLLPKLFSLHNLIKQNLNYFRANILSCEKNFFVFQ